MQLVRTRRLLLALVAITVLAVGALLTPTRAEATAPQNFRGWTYVNANACPPAGMCTMIYRYEAPTWVWSGNRWYTSSIGDGTRVYAWPFAPGWHWIWTDYTGWQAVNSYRLYGSLLR